MKIRNALISLSFGERDMKRGGRAAIGCAMMLMLLAVTGMAEEIGGIIRGDAQAY